jgi:hypothetical protein
MVDMDRTKQFHLMVSEEEHERLKGLAKANDMSASDYVRWVLGWYSRHFHPKGPAEVHKKRGREMKADLAAWDAGQAGSPLSAWVDRKNRK